MEIPQSLDNAEKKFNKGIDCKFRIICSIRKFCNSEFEYGIVIWKFWNSDILEFENFRIWKFWIMEILEFKI